jgi:hypothetical protein
MYRRTQSEEHQQHPGHSIVLEGGFDRWYRFFFIPLGVDERVHESLSQYVVRAPVSLEKIVWEGKTDTVVWKSPVKSPHKGKERSFIGLDFIAQLTMHIPPRGTHLVRRYGICSSRTRGTWKKRPALYKRAAECWYGRGENTVAAVKETEEEVTVSKKKSREAWVRLLAKVYEINVLCCPHCGGRMSVTAVIRDPESIGEIIFYMENKGRGPPQARNSIRPLIDSVQ